MKKLILFAIIILSALQSNAQFLNGIGVTIGGTAANEKFKFREPISISRKNYIFGFNASVFLECLSHDNVRWITEIQYNQKGSIDKQPEASYANQLQYLCWNNYLKFRYEMYRIIPYVMVGPRLEYALAQGTSSPVITGSFLPFHVSAAVGGGLEFVSYTNFKFFVEGFYNPDIMPAYIDPLLHINNKAFELRIGLKYEFAGRKETCNTPTYVE
jgi:hypothetical protein